MKCTITLKKTRETKGAIRFETDRSDAAITNIYVRKPVGTELGETIEVVVTKK